MEKTELISKFYKEFKELENTDLTKISNDEILGNIIKKSMGFEKLVDVGGFELYELYILEEIIDIYYNEATRRMRYERLS